MKTEEFKSGERLFAIIGNRLISCNQKCGSDENNGYVSPFLDGSPFGVKIDKGFTWVCIYDGENKRGYSKDSINLPQIKQENGRPRICLNHLSPCTITDLISKEVFTTPLERA